MRVLTKMAQISAILLLIWSFDLQAQEKKTDKAPEKKEDKPEQKKQPEKAPDAEKKEKAPKEDNKKDTTAEIITKMKPMISAIPEVIKIMVDFPDEKTVKAGLDFIASTGSEDSRVMSFFVDLAYHDNEEIKKQARAKLLNGLASSLRKKLLSRDFFNKKKAALLLAKKGKIEMAILLKLFRSMEKRSQEAAVAALSEIGTDVVLPLLALIEVEQDPVLYNNVLKVLQNLDEKAIAPLVITLGDHRHLVRKMSKEALVRQGKGAIGPCLEIFRSQPSELLGNAVGEILLDIGLDSLPALVALTSDSKIDVQRFAQSVIKKFGTKALPLLLDIYNKSKTEKEKERALKSLSTIKIEDPKQVVVILELLRPLLKKEGKLQYHALKILRHTKDAPKEVIGDLKSVINAESWQVRAEAAYCMAEAGESASPALRTLIRRLNQEEYGDVKIAICKAMGSMGAKAKSALPALRKCIPTDGYGDELIIVAASEAIGNIGAGAKAAIPDLIKAFSLVGYEGRKTIAQAISKMGKPALKPLRTALRWGEYEGSRCGAALAIGYMGSEGKSAVYDLTRALQFDEEVVMVDAAYALGEINVASKKVIQALINACSESDAVGRAASKSLGKIGKPALSRINRAMRSSNPKVVLAMIRALGYMEDGAINMLPTLIKRLQKKESLEEQKAIVHTIGQMGQKAESSIPALVELLKHTKNEELHDTLQVSLLKLGPKVLPLLMPVLGANEPIAVENASIIIKKSGKQATPFLLEYIQPDKEEKVRINAMDILSEFPENVSIFINVLITFDQQNIRRHIIGIIQSKYSKNAIPLLIQSLLESKSAEQGKVVNDTLIAIGAPAVPALLNVLKNNKDAVIRSMIIQTIGEIGPKAKLAVEYLVSSLESIPFEEKVLIITCLGKLGKDALPHLIELLQQNNPEIRQVVIHALGATKSADAVTYLLKTLQNPETLPLVVNAMVSMKQTAIPVLLKSLASKDKNIRFACAAALFEISSPVAIKVLEKRLENEQDPMIKYMLLVALRNCRKTQ